MSGYALLITGQKGLSILENSYQAFSTELKAVLSYDDPSTTDEAFGRIKSFCEKKSIPFHEAKKAQDVESILAPSLSNEITLVLVAGWQFLISDKVVENCDVVCFHDSLLPKYRGFAPVVTSLIKGEKELGITALKADKGIDTGPIFKTQSIFIEYPIKLQEALNKLYPLYIDLALETLKSWSEGHLDFAAQENSQATYSLWRNSDDFSLDWSLGSDELLRTIHALGTPYAGACAKWEGHIIRILDAEVVNDLSFEIRQPGKIWTYQDGHPIVVCGQGMLKLTEMQDESGAPFKPQKLRVRLS